MRGLDFRIPDDIERPAAGKPRDAPEAPAMAAKKDEKAGPGSAKKPPGPEAMGAESILRTGVTERSAEVEGAGEGEPELAEGVEATAESEAGEGEPVCAYGVEVVELLEMEPINEQTRRPKRRIPWNKYASAAFILVFVLGVVNAAVSALYSSGVVSPAETFQSPTCELAGEVKDAAGRPIPGASVVVTDTSRSAVTNSDGWYVITGLSPGPHRVEADAEGYSTMSVKTDLQPNMLNTIDFTLEKGGQDVRLDESSAPDFGAVGSSYLWAVPLLVFFSVCALAAAILSLRRKRFSLPTLALGALGVLSFGFGVGSVLAVVGTVLSALPVPEGGALPLKKLRVGVSYPSKASAARPRAINKIPAASLEERSYGEFDRAAAVESGGVKAGEAVPPQAPPAEGAVPDLKPVPPVEGAEPALKPVPPAERAEPGKAKRILGPKRFIRRSAKGALRCYTCVEEISPGTEYIKCACGRTIHVRCLEEPRCPSCGEKFGRAVAR